MSETFSLADLASLTGLTTGGAQALTKKFSGSPRVALAALVQSLDKVPPSAFHDSKIIQANANKINAILSGIYKEVREIRESQKLSEEAAWKSLAQPTKPTPTPASVVPAPSAANPSAPNKFVFGKAAPSNTTASKTEAPSSTALPTMTFGFGTQKSAATTAAPASGAAQSSGFSFGFAKPAASGPAIPVAAPAPNKKEVVYGEPTYNTGALLECPGFWEKEVLTKATLFNLDKGFMEKNRDKIRTIQEKWLEKAKFFSDKVKYVPIHNRDEETARVVIKDAERTFFDTEFREKFAEFLHSMYIELGTYGQSMSYLAGICNLGLNEQETASILRLCAKQYINGHWAAEAIGFATNAFVFEHILKKTDEAVVKHFRSLDFTPEMYLQKIFSGLCVHVLPFEELFEFLTAFLDEGLSWLIKFAMGIVEVFRSDILNIKHSSAINELFGIMRLDRSVVDASEIRRVFIQARKIDISAFDLRTLHAEMYDQFIGPRIARAPKEAAFEPCTLCEKEKPAWYSDDFGIACGACKEKHPNAEWEAY